MLILNISNKKFGNTMLKMILLLIPVLFAFSFYEYDYPISVKVLTYLCSIAYFFYLGALAKTSKKYIVTIFVSVYSLLFLLLLLSMPDKDVFTLSSLDKNDMINRQNYYKVGLIGHIYGRKVGKYYFDNIDIKMTRAIKKIAYPLDISKYFFSDTPSLYPYVLLPFMIVGLVYVLAHRLKEFLVYCGFSFPATIWILPRETLVLYIPLLSSFFVMGVYWLFKKALYYKKRHV